VLPGTVPSSCGTLFQLLIPNEFKDAARQMDQIVLVLDRYTADLPWELMLADDKPLAVRAAVVRQLSAVRFRPRVRQAAGRRAYVIGNPSTAGFAAAFPGLSPNTDGALAELPGAEAEAKTVAQTLVGFGFEVTSIVGRDQRAGRIIAGLYRGEYRILHIAAHGTFNFMLSNGEALWAHCSTKLCYLVRQHPFRETTIGEDIEWAREVLLTGYRLAYVPDAAVIHSHERSASYEFDRTRVLHRRLYELFGVRTIPTPVHLARAIASCIVTHLRFERSARALALAFAWPLGQYVGALSAARGWKVRPPRVA